ncbi:MAG: hypothetical protein WA851_16185 [Xanthobacteraceae bacterium]
MVGFFWIGSILSILGGVIIAVAIVSWQIIQWLKYGLWPPLPLQAASNYVELPLPVTSWIGANHLIQRILQLPLSLSLFVALTIVAMFFMKIATTIEKNESARKRASLKERL